MQKTGVLEGNHDGLECDAQKVHKSGVERERVSPRDCRLGEQGKTEYEKLMPRQLVVTLEKLVPEVLALGPEASVK